MMSSLVLGSFPACIYWELGMNSIVYCELILKALSCTIIYTYCTCLSLHCTFFTLSSIFEIELIFIDECMIINKHLLLFLFLFYFLDNYVHRLVQNKSDGKVVEVPGNEEVIICICLSVCVCCD